MSSWWRWETLSLELRKTFNRLDFRNFLTWFEVHDTGLTHTWRTLKTFGIWISCLISTSLIFLWINVNYDISLFWDDNYTFFYMLNLALELGDLWWLEHSLFFIDQNVIINFVGLDAPTWFINKKDKFHAC